MVERVLLHRRAATRVYRECCDALNADVAVKEVARSAKGSSKRMFETEMKVCPLVAHPNICQFFGHAVRDDVHRLTFELCDGTALERPDLAVDVVLDVCKALEYLYEKGIAHRDVKPSNILVLNNVAKLADFGLATTVLPSRELVGTPNYVAPEILDRNVSHDARVDLWSLGCTVQVLFGGLAPFADVGNSIEKTLASVRLLAPTSQPPPKVAGIVRRLLVQRGERASLSDVSQWFAESRDDLK